MHTAKENKNRVKPQGRTTTNAFPTVVVLLIIVGLIRLLSVLPRFHQPANVVSRGSLKAKQRLEELINHSRCHSRNVEAFPADLCKRNVES